MGLCKSPSYLLVSFQEPGEGECQPFVWVCVNHQVTYLLMFQAAGEGEPLPHQVAAGAGPDQVLPDRRGDLWESLQPHHALSPVPPAILRLHPAPTGTRPSASEPRRKRVRGLLSFYLCCPFIHTSLNLSALTHVPTYSKHPSAVMMGWGDAHFPVLCLLV